MKLRLVPMYCLVASVAVSSSAIAEDRQGSIWPKSFRDWWQTPEQQAVEAWQEGDVDRVLSIAPSPVWEGAALYEKGEYESAAEAFATMTEQRRRSFNEGTTQVRLGDYAKAIEHFDAVLENHPDDVDASRNRAIAERLLELEQQSQQGEGGESGESADSSDQSESQSGDSSSEQDGSEESGEQEGSSESDESSGDDSNEESGADTDDGSDADTQSEAERNAEIEAAREALQMSEGEVDSPEGEMEVPVETEEPMTESEQASEQWLRRIPDDPDGLLRRKLLQNHRTEFPEVQVNGRGW